MDMQDNFMRTRHWSTTAFRFAAVGIVSFLTLTLSACTQTDPNSKDPKERLSEYIGRTFSVKAYKDREELLGYLTGDARTRLSAWSEDQFAQAFLENKREFSKLAFREVKTVKTGEVNITYEVTYTQNKVTKITNKKLATLTLEGGRWLISGVRNIAELVEYQNEMSLP